MSTNDIPAMRRQLKIKAGVVKRLDKENSLYKKETEDQQRRLDKLKADGTNDDDWEWKLKNGKKLLEESNKMIIDSVARLQLAVTDLRTLVNSATKEDQLAEDKEFLNAKEILEVASA